MIAIVCGGRDYTDRERLERELDERLSGLTVLIEGGASGADRLARQWAKARGIHVATVEAQWSQYGGRAGPLRNEAMAALRPNCLIAFPGGAGTRSMVAIAKLRGITVWEVD